MKIKNLKVSIDNKVIINDLSVEFEENKVHVLMGPNGSGKSTLAMTLMGHPLYEVLDGEVIYKNKNILELEPNERSNEGLFLSFQYPSEITGVTISSYLRLIYNKKMGTKLSPVKFREILKEKMKILEMDESFMNRYLNEGFSGGEKKRMEMLQMLVLEPSFVILDETDSGLDIDAVKIVANAVNLLKEKTNMTVLVITHYTRILKYITADFVHILDKGRIVKIGGHDLAEQLEEKGYEPFLSS